MNLENKASDYIQAETEIFQDTEINNTIPEKSTFKFFDFLKSKTGEGSIENYNEHPLNYNKSNSLAQIIRGLTGILGSLDLAIVDISLGFLRIIQEKKKVGADL